MCLHYLMKGWYHESRRSYDTISKYSTCMQFEGKLSTQPILLPLSRKQATRGICYFLSLTDKPVLNLKPEKDSMRF